MREVVPSAFQLESPSSGVYSVTLGATSSQIGLDFADAPSPVAIASQIGDGTPQRSIVKLLTLKFSSPVALSPGAITMSRRNTGGSGGNDGSPPTDLSADILLSNPSGDGMTWVVKFLPNSTGADSNGGLFDGIYDIAVHGSDVTAAAGGAFASQTITFTRLFGDIDGNGTVNSADYFRFKQAFGSTVGQARYSAGFDFDGNGSIDSADYFQFKKRFGKTFNLTPASTSP